MSAPPTTQGVPIESHRQLVDYIASGSKPPAEWRIGTEHEKFVYRLSDLRRLPYDGEGPTIRKLLEGLATRYGWTPVEENGNPIALIQGRASVTLEPGGQFELSGAPLETILRALSARGVTQPAVQFLGTGIWDDVALLRQVNLDGAWLASSSPYNTTQFEARFKTTYKYTPPRVASLAYDAVALAVTLAASGRDYSAESLTNPAGFVGPANGIFRLNPDGTVERGLAVIRVEGTTLKMITPAPTGFSLTTRN